MSEAECSCASFARLEGASVPAYVTAFLDEVKGENRPGVKRYRCRACGRAWEKRPPAAGGGRPSLVRLD